MKKFENLGSGMPNQEKIPNDIEKIEDKTEKSAEENFSDYMKLNAELLSKTSDKESDFREIIIKMLGLSEKEKTELEEWIDDFFEKNKERWGDNFLNIFAQREYGEKVQKDEIVENMERKDNEVLINKATSFEELISIIDSNQIEIQGSQQVFTADMLKDVITKIRDGELSLDVATKNDGFRAKLTEFLYSKSSIDYLKKKLDEIENKLVTQSFVSGASTNHPLNKRKDELLKQKETLQQNIRNIEEKLNV